MALFQIGACVPLPIAPSFTDRSVDAKVAPLGAQRIYLYNAVLPKDLHDQLVQDVEGHLGPVITMKGADAYTDSRQSYLFSCTERALRNATPPIRVIQASDVSDEQIKQAVDDLEARASVRNLNVKYIIQIGGEERYAMVGPWFIIVGAMTGVQETLLSARIWDLTDGTDLGTVTVKAKGNLLWLQWFAVAIVWPRTQSAACKALAGVLHSMLASTQQGN